MSNEVTKPERDQTIKLDVSARVFPVKEPKMEKGSILAFASADIGGCFAVKGIKIVEGKDGPFVAMPSQMSKDRKHFDDICFPTTTAMREALDTVVMDAYRDVLEQQATRAAQAVERISERVAKPSVRGALKGATKEAAERQAAAPTQERTADRGER